MITSKDIRIWPHRIWNLGLRGINTVIRKGIFQSLFLSNYPLHTPYSFPSSPSFITRFISFLSAKLNQCWFMTSLKGILYIILPHNHSFHFLTVTPPTLHLLLQILPFLSFFNYLYQRSPFCIDAIRAELLFSLISPEFACAGCRCALIMEHWWSILSPKPCSIWSSSSRAV